MEAYLGSQELKDKTVLAMQQDINAERLVQGHYWEGDNGCFVGCVIRGNEHSKFETQIGVPRILAYLGDRLFERLNYEDAKKFSLDYLNAIKPGADLSMVWPKFAHFMLVGEEYGVINFAKKPETKKVIQDVADLYQRKINGENIDINEWLTAKKTAAAAADAAADAYAYAAAAAYAYAYADAAARKRHAKAMAAKLIELLAVT